MMSYSEKFDKFTGNMEKNINKCFPVNFIKFCGTLTAQGLSDTGFFSD